MPDSLEAESQPYPPLNGNHNGRNGFAYAKGEGGPRRLFHRHSNRTPALAAPYPRPRDEHGDARQRTLVHSHPPPPAGKLAQEHQASIALIEKYRPLRAAQLRDMIQRIDAAIARYHDVAAEEEERLHHYNEDAGFIRERIEGLVKAIEAEKATVYAAHDKICDERRQTLSAAREELAVQRAKNGLPFTLKDWGANEDASSEAPEAPAAIDAIAEAVGAVAKAAVEQPGRVAANVADTTRNVAETVQHAAPVVGQLASMLSSLLKKREQAPHSEAKAEGPDTATTTVVEPITPVQPDLHQQHAQPELLPPRFDMALGQEHARPPDVIAFDNGIVLPDIQASAAGNKRLGSIITLACGCIFGISLGSMLGLLDLDALTAGRMKALFVFVACALFGWAIFGLFGSAIEIFASWPARLRANAMVAQHRGNPTAIGLQLEKSAKWAFWIGITALVVLGVIECCVERFGVVQAAIDNAEAQIMLHQVAAPKMELTGIAGWVVALVACVPFILWHAGHGWTAEEDKILRAHAAAGSRREAWELATKRYADDVTEHKLQRAEREKAEKQRLIDEADKVTQAEIQALEAVVRQKHQSTLNGDGPITIPATMPTVAPAPMPPTVEPLPEAKEGLPVDQQSDSTETIQADALRDKSINLAPTLDDLRGSKKPATSPPASASASLVESPESENVGQGSQEIHVSPDVIESRVNLARANEKARDANIRLREAYARRRDAVEPYDKKIADLNAQIIEERIEMPTESRRRLEDAFSDYSGAVVTFDELFAQEVKAVERLMRPGIFVNLRNFFFNKWEGI